MYISIYLYILVIRDKILQNEGVKREFLLEKILPFVVDRNFLLKLPAPRALHGDLINLVILAIPL